MEVRNVTKERFETRKLEKLADRILLKEKKGKSNLSLLFAGEALMKKLSVQWLKKEHASNVLAFEGGHLSLGEIVLCPSVIRKDAKEYGITYKDAVRLMFVHGLLHLVGYDHDTFGKEKAMKRKEQEYMKLA